MFAVRSFLSGCMSASQTFLKPQINVTMPAASIFCPMVNFYKPKLVNKPGKLHRKTKIHRLRMKAPKGFDTSKFAIETWTPRQFRVKLPEEYTTAHLPMHKTGGRDPNTGRIAVHGIGGGAKRNFRWIDFYRLGPSEDIDLEERVLSIEYDPNRSARIALVANDVVKRYIIATANMKPGDLIRSSRTIPDTDVIAKEGDAHAVGALAIGTKICLVEMFPRAGAMKVRAAGSSAVIISKSGDYVTIKMGKKAEFSIHKDCLVVVGQVSNPEHMNRVIGSAQRNRWLGKRPRSGKFHKKTGRFGRKLRLPPKLKVFDPKFRNESMLVSPPLAARR